MAADLKPKAKRLVAEFQTKLNLSDVDSRRAAFVVLAFAGGWRKARIARYLDVHRQRIGQKITRYQQYADSGDWPEIGAALAKLQSPGPENGGRNVTFSRIEWESIDFANDLLNRLA
jgi:hypothetical protein